MERMGAHYDKRGLNAVSVEGMILAHAKLWRDVPKENQHAILGPYSDGDVTEVRIDDLCRYLSLRDMHLVIKVEITRDVRTKDREGSRRYEPSVPRIYLLRSDGVLEWLGGSRQIG